MEMLVQYLFAVAVVVIVIATSWQFHFWSNSSTARRSRSPLWLGFSATASSGLFLIAGLIGFDLSKRGRFFAGTGWADGVIWWEVLIGLVLAPGAIYLLRRGVRDIERGLRRI